MTLNGKSDPSSITDRFHGRYKMYVYVIPEDIPDVEYSFKIDAMNYALTIPQNSEKMKITFSTCWSP